MRTEKRTEKRTLWPWMACLCGVLLLTPLGGARAEEGKLEVVAWGKPSGGLRCALVLDGKARLGPAELLTAHLRLRNCGEHLASLRLKVPNQWTVSLAAPDTLTLFPLYGDAAAIRLEPGQESDLPGTPIRL